MAIFRQLSNPWPMTFTEISVSLTTQSTTIPKPVFQIEACLCDFECDFTEKAIADLANPTDPYKNDVKDLFWQIADSSGSLEFYLVDKNDVETLLVDATHGVAFALGFNTTQPRQGGFIADWNKIATIFGFGDYSLRAVETSFTEEYRYNTHKFNLRPYSEMFTRNTVRIETVMNGCHIAGFDYTGLNWSRWVRLVAKFGATKPTLTNETYLNTLREVDQIETQVLNEYTLSTGLLPPYIATPMLEDKMLGDKIIVSIYDYTTFEMFDGSSGWVEKRVNDALELTPISYEEPVYNRGTKGAYVIKFNDRKQDNIKRP